MKNTGSLTVDEIQHLFSEQIAEASPDWIISSLNYLKVQLHGMPEKRRRIMVKFLALKLAEKVQHEGILECR